MRVLMVGSAAALTFTTLLSLVPLMTVSLSVFYAFPIADRFQAQLQDWLFRSFVPAVSEVLKQHLQAFSDKAAHLSGLGFGMLLVVALMLMMNIDAALNRIWNARAPRSRASKFLIYWAVLTLGPVLIAVSMLASAWLARLPLVSGLAASDAGHLALALTPLLASFAAFTLMYTVGDLRGPGGGPDLPGLAVSLMGDRAAGRRGGARSAYLSLASAQPPRPGAGRAGCHLAVAAAGRGGGAGTGALAVGADCGAPGMARGPGGGAAGGDAEARLGGGAG